MPSPCDLRAIPAAQVLDAARPTVSAGAPPSPEGGGAEAGSGGGGGRCTALQLFGGDVVCDAAGRPFLIELNTAPMLSDTLAPGSDSRRKIGRPLICRLPEVVARSGLADDTGDCGGWLRL
jgi:hypothetical protein